MYPFLESFAPGPCRTTRSFSRCTSFLKSLAKYCSSGSCSAVLAEGDTVTGSGCDDDAGGGGGAWRSLMDALTAALDGRAKPPHAKKFLPAVLIRPAGLSLSSRSPPGESASDAFLAAGTHFPALFRVERQLMASFNQRKLQLPALE